MTYVWRLGSGPAVGTWSAPTSTLADAGALIAARAALDVRASAPREITPGPDGPGYLNIGSMRLGKTKTSAAPRQKSNPTI